MKREIISEKKLVKTVYFDQILFQSKPSTLRWWHPYGNNLTLLKLNLELSPVQICSSECWKADTVHSPANEWGPQLQQSVATRTFQCIACSCVERTKTEWTKGSSAYY